MEQKRKNLIKFLLITNVVLLLLAIGMYFLYRNTVVIDPDPVSKDVEIVYWGIWESDDVMHPLIEKYEAENPGVKIKYAQQSFRNYEETVYTRLEQATSSTEPAPDVVRIHNTWLPKYEKYLTPLPEDVMSAQTYAQEFYPTAVDDLTGRDGKIYAIPLHIDGLMVIYNTDIFSKAGYTAPPKDWDSFMEVAQALTKRDTNGKITQSGLAIGTSKNIVHSIDILSYFLLQNKVQVMNSTRDQVNLTTSRAISALDTYTSFVQDDNATWAIYLPSDLTKFQNGELAMMFGTSWRALDILENAPNINFALAPLPRLPNNEEVYYSSYWADAVTSTSKNSKEAWKFVEFLSQPEQQRRLFQNAAKVRYFGQPYSRVSMNSELLENKYTKAIAQMAPYMKSWQMGEQSFVEDLLKDAITAIVENRQDSSSVLIKIQADINEKLAVSNK